MKNENHTKNALFNQDYQSGCEKCLVTFFDENVDGGGGAGSSIRCGGGGGGDTGSICRIEADFRSRWIALDEVYQIYILLHLSIHKCSAIFRQQNCKIAR